MTDDKGNVVALTETLETVDIKGYSYRIYTYDGKQYIFMRSTDGDEADVLFECVNRKPCEIDMELNSLQLFYETLADNIIDNPKLQTHPLYTKLHKKVKAEPKPKKVKAEPKPKKTTK